MEAEEQDIAEHAALRLQSDSESDPVTGAMLGMAGLESLAGSNDLLDTPPTAAKENARRKSITSKKSPSAR